VSITLQSTIEGGFSAEFMRRLPALEQAMIAHGLEPASFVISKDRATPPSVPFIGPFFYAYTVFVADVSFTVTEEPPEQERRRRRPGLINRIFRWMAQPI
jgi:hypothetical protein